MSLSGPSLKVLKTFVARANEQYRAAGMSEYQMRVRRDGSVEIPMNGRRSRFPAPAAAAAPTQAADGAAATQRSGAAPAISDLKASGSDGFVLTWQPVQGAVRYGVWQDGTLMGHVTSPTFRGTLGTDSGGTIQIDAVMPDGTRTELTQPVQALRSGSAAVTFAAAGAAQAQPA